MSRNATRKFLGSSQLYLNRVFCSTSTKTCDTSAGAAGAAVTRFGERSGWKQNQSQNQKHLGYSSLSKAHLQPFNQPEEHGGEVMLTRGEGVYVYDTNGKEYLDGLSGLWSNSLGNGNERIIAAASNQMKKLAYQHTFWNRTTDIAEEYSSKLVEFCQPSLGVTQTFFSSGGSDANDTNMKLAWYYWTAMGKPDKVKIIAREKAYHGVTAIAASVSGMPKMHKGFGPLPLPWVSHVSTPHYWRNGFPGETEEEYSSRLAKELEDLILREGPDTISAFIAEPVMGAGGVIPPPKGYFEKIQPVLRKYDILFILDEVRVLSYSYRLWIQLHSCFYLLDLHFFASLLTPTIGYHRLWAPW